MYHCWCCEKSPWIAHRMLQSSCLFHATSLVSCPHFHVPAYLFAEKIFILFITVLSSFILYNSFRYITFSSYFKRFINFFSMWKRMYECKFWSVVNKRKKQNFSFFCVFQTVYMYLCIKVHTNCIYYVHRYVCVCKNMSIHVREWMQFETLSKWMTGTSLWVICVQIILWNLMNSERNSERGSFPCLNIFSLLCFEFQFPLFLSWTNLIKHRILFVCDPIVELFVGACMCNDAWKWHFMCKILFHRE